MFKLTFPIPTSDDKILRSDSIVSIGSCFAGNMGINLRDSKFNVLSNPFGTIYNPISLSRLLIDDWDDSAVVEQKGVHYHWQAHGEVSDLSRQVLQVLVSERRSMLQKSLQSADWLIVTLGSAFAYRLKSSGQIVANCHKVPQSEFTKELLGVDEMITHLSQAIEYLTLSNPKLKVILTVSPVRHIRDGLVENNRSKSRLIEVAQLCDRADVINYFPAYEIMIDELRDYRFYTKDRVHPSEEAIEYIWNRFAETYFNEDTRYFINEWSQIRNALHHRPFHPKSKEHQAFLRSTISKLNELSNHVDVTIEVSLLERHLL
jgi:lysophospholipase L1-like esterase